MTGDSEFEDGVKPAVLAAETRRQCFSSLDVTRVRQGLASLHEQVACGRGRVEIKRRGREDICVMISKAELEALEAALEILSDSAEYKSMCENLSQIAAEAGGYHVAPACS